MVTKLLSLCRFHQQQLYSMNRHFRCINLIRLWCTHVRAIPRRLLSPSYSLVHSSRLHTHIHNQLLQTSSIRTLNRRLVAATTPCAQYLKLNSVRTSGVLNVRQCTSSPSLDQLVQESIYSDFTPHEDVIKRDIRAPKSPDEKEVVTPRLKEVLRGVYHGERAKLAEAITLVESKHPFKHKQAQWLLTKLLSHRSKQMQLGKLKPTYRIGLSGPPGAGKSTLIETFGQLLTGQGYKIAVLAVDPSSSQTGGSIMGDKTRMPTLSRDPTAYIRPSPSGGTLGGVTRNTNEAISLCEGAGFDVILVETVGVGQSETAVSDMVDMFVLVIPPAAGDELQGLKRGIVEMSDLIIINKADGDLLPAARRIQAEYISALRLARSRHREWTPQVIKVSALLGENIDQSWEVMLKFFKVMMKCGDYDSKRKNQQRLWLWNHIDWELRDRFRSHRDMASHIAAMEMRVMAGSMAPGTAADVLLDRFFKLH